MTIMSERYREKLGQFKRMDHRQYRESELLARGQAMDVGEAEQKRKKTGKLETPERTFMDVVRTGMKAVGVALHRKKNK